MNSCISRLCQHATKVRARMQVTWQWQRFINEARTDNLQLEHWAKCHKDSAGNLRPDYEGPYRWAKLDVKVGAAPSRSRTGTLGDLAPPGWVRCMAALGDCWAGSRRVVGSRIARASVLPAGRPSSSPTIQAECC